MAVVMTMNAAVIQKRRSWIRPDVHSVASISAQAARTSTTKLALDRRGPGAQQVLLAVSSNTEVVNCDENHLPTICIPLRDYLSDHGRTCHYSLPRSAVQSEVVRNLEYATGAVNQPAAGKRA